MKKERKWRMAFEELQKSYPQMRQQAAASGARHLFHYETAIRNQIRRLRKIPEGLTPEYRTVFDGYTALLDDVSRRLLEQYNQKHQSDYRFESIVDGHREDYLSSGIIAVLMTSHIPQMVTAEFQRLLPKHPQEDYPKTRRMPVILRYALRQRTRGSYLHISFFFAITVAVFFCSVPAQ